ncbi:MAG: molybdopterin-dependent oxidoreductase [Magnetococcales bacterium]|nr:molybdopterin-dependent oxidoreductase [Magnetococcales bacterium]
MAEIRRRTFLKLGVGAVCAASSPAWLNAMELKLGGQDFHQIRTFHPRTTRHYACTLCPYFDGGITYSEGTTVLKAEGNPDHIATRGKFCSKGLASFFAASDPDRIVAPMKRVGPRGSGEWQEITWDEAIKTVAGKVQAALATGADSIWLNEGSFKSSATVRFMDTIGSTSVIRSTFPTISNVVKESLLKKVMGVDFTLPDLEHTKYVLAFGANILETAFPLAQRLTDGMVNNRLKLVTFDVRQSNTAGRSDEWFPVFPGSDGIIALAMANVIMQRGLADTNFIDTYTNTTSQQLAEQLKPFTLEMAEAASGVSAANIKRIALVFAKNKPATVFAFNGVSWHQGGMDREMACLLLAVITGNIDNEGGHCLPRRIVINDPKPAPAEVASNKRQLHYRFPFDVKAGKSKVQVLFNHMSNPAYSTPAASVWREVLKDEKLIPFLVDFSPFMSETAEFADLILPDVVGVERYDLVSAPTALWPWASISSPDAEPAGAAQDVRVTLKKIVEALDADGQKGWKTFWAFADAKDYVKFQIAATPELEKQTKVLRKAGFWPEYGKIDPANRKIVKDGEPVEATYGTFKSKGFATPSGKIEVRPLKWSANPNHEKLQKGQFVLTTYKVATQSRSLTNNLKYLSEIWHANPLWINKKVAGELGIKDGALVRVTSEVGYMVTKAWVTQGIHPQVVGMSTSVGRTAYGSVAQARPNKHPAFAKAERHDPDIDDNVWWRDGGTNANDLIPINLDPESGAQLWNDTVVTVAPAQPGDKYGDIRVDNAKHLAIYQKMLGQA